MGNSLSDTYTKDPIVRSLGSTLRAVPVLPVLPELQVYDFLQRRTDGFHHVGNVADLCCPGEKQKALAKMVKRMSNVTTSKEDVALKSCVENKGDLSSKLQVLNSVSWSALWSKSRTLEFEIPNWHKTCWTKKSERAQLFEGFNLDARALPTTSRKSGTVTLYLVTDVIKVPSLKVTAWDKDGHAVEAAVPVDGTTPAVTGNMKIEKAKGGYFQLQSSNPRRPFPVAFRGIKCVFKHGLLQKWEPTTYKPDSAAGCLRACFMPASHRWLLAANAP